MQIVSNLYNIYIRLYIESERIGLCLYLSFNKKWGYLIQLVFSNNIYKFILSRGASCRPIGKRLNGYHFMSTCVVCGVLQM